MARGGVCPISEHLSGLRPREDSDFEEFNAGKFSWLVTLFELCAGSDFTDPPEYQGARFLFDAVSDLEEDNLTAGAVLGVFLTGCCTGTFCDNGRF